jgi:hypothetical protein
MIFVTSYFLLALLLISESMVLAYVLRGTIRAALDHEARRSSPIGLSPTILVPENFDDSQFHELRSIGLQRLP